MQQHIGDMLDNRYELLELIGTGGMSNVFKAKCHRLNRLVAIKILKSELAEDVEFRRRFRDESLAVAALSHANIVSVYDVSSSGGVEYIVMELIDGITLKQYMERRGQMDWREALHFITQIMYGLSHAHSRGIIHRDIKPQNIMVLRDGSVKVADFGIACLANTTNTLTQEALGSVHYISPEQARGERTDARSDVYSAGVVLYEMLTGRLPFEGDSAVSVAIQHLSGIPLNPREINPEIPEALELICMKAMNSDLKKRYASANAMIEDLEAFRKNPSVNLDYIRRDMAVSIDDEPTVPMGEVTSAVRQQEKQQRIEAEARQYNQKKKKRHKMILVSGIIAAVALIVVLFSLILRSFSGNHSDGTYEVPNILGYTLEQAQSLESIQDVFEIKVIGTKTDSNYQAGQIVSQDPGEGTIRKSNLVIQVYLCAEEEDILMPDLTGKDYQHAKIQLQGMNLQLEIEKEEDFSNEIAAGEIMMTFPETGMTLRKGDTVTLVISKGPATVTVISFTGMDLDSAIQAATELGLVVGDIHYERSFRPSGQVIKQSISMNSEVPGGTEIAFTVSGSSSTRLVYFSLPEELDGEASVMAEVYLDGMLVDTKILNTPSASTQIPFSFDAPSGENHVVFVLFDGIKTEEQSIQF